MFAVNSENRPNYYKYLARVNYSAALAADNKVGFWPGYEIAAPPPVMTLCAHSIELSFKAFLLDHDLSEKEVRNLGHKLCSAWERCVELGASADLPNVETLKIIEDLLVSGRLRYGDQSEMGKIPVFGPLQELCEYALKICGAPDVGDILDGH
jgi:hypothetical protein